MKATRRAIALSPPFHDFYGRTPVPPAADAGRTATRAPSHTWRAPAALAAVGFLSGE